MTKLFAVSTNPIDLKGGDIVRFDMDPHSREIHIKCSKAYYRVLDVLPEGQREGGQELFAVHLKNLDNNKEIIFPLRKNETVPVVSFF